MKKLLLSAVVLMGGFVAANAEEISYAPTAGSFSTEIQFNPFSHDGVFQNGGVFSGTYFCTDNFAVMFDLGLGGENKKDVEYDDPTSANPKEEGFMKQYHGTFQLSLGAKYYFYNYKRINLYAGAKVSYFHNFAGTKNVDKDTDNWTWNNTFTPEPDEDGNQPEPIKTSNGFGVYAFTGIDFSIYKGLYIGAELNVGFRDDIYSGTTFKVHTNSNNTTETFKNKVGGHSLNGGFNVTPVFRLGWNF